MFKILVWGAGYIGIFLGAKLYAMGHNVVLYGRRKLKNLINPILINGEVYQIPSRTYQLEIDNYNIILVTAKLYDVKSALEEIRKYQFHPQIIGFLQNGIVDQSFYEEFASHPGFITFSVFNGYNLAGNEILVRESELGLQVEDTWAGQRICEVLTAADIKCYTTSNMPQTRARKLVVNAALNALSAIERKTIGDLIKNRQLKAVIEGIVRESWEVLKDDYNLPSLTFLQKEIFSLSEQVKEHYSSMYQDLISGRKTEIEFINGTIIRLGKERGIPTPCNQQVYLKLLDQERSIGGKMDIDNNNAPIRWAICG